MREDGGGVALREKRDGYRLGGEKKAPGNSTLLVQHQRVSAGNNTDFWTEQFVFGNTYFIHTCVN